MQMLAREDEALMGYLHLQIKTALQKNKLNDRASVCFVYEMSQ